MPSDTVGPQGESCLKMKNEGRAEKQREGFFGYIFWALDTALPEIQIFLAL